MSTLTLVPNCVRRVSEGEEVANDQSHVSRCSLRDDVSLSHVQARSSKSLVPAALEQTLPSSLPLGVIVFHLTV